MEASIKDDTDREEFTYNIKRTTFKTYFHSRPQPICGENTAKIPGFVIDRKLSLENHTSEVCKKLPRVTFLMRKMKASISEHFILTDYQAIFQSPDL